MVIVGGLPQDVPGLGHLTERRQRLNTLLAALGPVDTPTSSVSEALVGEGRVIIGSHIEDLLQTAGIQREGIVDTGIEFIRRRDDSGSLYFLTNLGQQTVDQWVSLSVQAASVLLFDPAGDRVGQARTQPTDDGQTGVYVQLEPGESCLLRALVQPSAAPAWHYLAPAGQAYPLGNAWDVEFLEGGPTLPAARTIERLASWTEWSGDPALLDFAGTARYITVFERPNVTAESWTIDLGTVCDSARVRLNGHNLGTVYSHPFRVIVPDGVLEAHNRLEVEATNLMANRLADLDRRRAHWQKFLFVDIHYQPFDASAWEPLPSGLLGPVRLIPH